MTEEQAHDRDGRRPRPARILTLSPGGLPASERGTALAIGNFDGLHRGHQALIAGTRDAARRVGAMPAVLTFEPHPRTILRPDQPMFRLTPSAMKAGLLGAMGVPLMLEMAFDMELSCLPAEEFVARVLVQGLGVRAVCVGEDFRFGSRRGGDFALVAKLGRLNGFEAIAVPAEADANGGVYSSRLVRAAIEDGDIRRANAMLGYRWFIDGPVVHGDKRGRQLGYPTANIDLPATTRLRHGIYAVTAARPGGPPRAAIASFGVRPTFGTGGRPVLEVHLFDFAEDLYGVELTVVFVDWIRAEAHFATIAQLVEQIRLDCEVARAILIGSDGGSSIDAALGHATTTVP